MKTRNGFVSNSSSSSFIVALKKDLQKDELRTLLFGELEVAEIYDHSFTVDELMDAISHDYINQEPQDLHLDDENLVEKMTSGWYDGSPECPMEIYSMPKEEREIAYKVIAMIEKATATRKLRSFLMESLGFYDGDCFAYTFSYSDDNSFGSTLEHYGIFAKVPHIRISHH